MRKKAKIFPIIIMICLLAAGCANEDVSPTYTQNLEASIEPTPTEEVIPFTPSPEPSILINRSRGETVARIQRRLKDLGYLHYRPTGYYLDMTQVALKAFQEDNDSLQADGDAGQETLNELFNVYYPNRKNPSSVPGAEPPETKEPNLFGNALEWESVSQLIQQGTEFDVLDFESDYTVKMQRVGGNNHMHAEPVSSEDASSLKAMFSNIVSGEKRPVLVRYEGQIIAASMYGAPHGNYSIADNNFDGSVCIYFQGCTDEKYNIADEEHAGNINRATGQ